METIQPRPTARHIDEITRIIDAALADQTLVAYDPHEFPAANSVGFEG